MRKFSLAFSLCLILICRVHAQEPVRLTLTFLGDIMAHTVNYRVGDFHDVYRGLEDTLLGDDLTFANLEFPVDPTRPLQSYPQFNGSRDNWKAAVESGIDVFSLANNHTFDQGTEGILQTLRAAAWVEESSGRRITVSGTRGNPESPFRAPT
jgi:poly-gamma-glutamate capsule biosynthesis protein CapA/YwtB (metallophosphatase superfamily)